MGGYSSRCEKCNNEENEGWWYDQMLFTVPLEFYIINKQINKIKFLPF
ncbi:hypothetical protein BACCIP111899_02739 [Bacillus rhizoplanae]|uniref:Uncharacterized protein n=1 Tax=Bacillus rhizoplanae TaxID=2880966 RepID=A0ABN7ZZS4_9BACI|nr:hypothetical protein [Bacillus rhizoplanae]CAG9613524.1 hypothetical protein BACCIP111899_02739 [Bacillus rhizoplanae]